MSDVQNGPGWWQASDGKWYPPQSAVATMPPPPQAYVPVAPPAPPTGNGMAVAALTLGIIGALFGLIPLTFFIAGPCGLLAFIFGLVARGKAKKGGAPHKGMALAGWILGALAMVLAVVGVVIVNDAVTDVEDCFDAVSNDIEFGTDTADEACDS